MTTLNELFSLLVTIVVLGKGTKEYWRTGWIKRGMAQIHKVWNENLVEATNWIKLLSCTTQNAEQEFSFAHLTKVLQS